MADVKLTEKPLVVNPPANYRLIASMDVDGTESLRRVSISDLKDSQHFYKDILPTVKTENYMWQASKKDVSTWVHPNLAYYTYSVTPGNTYYASGLTPDAVATYPLIAFYDSDDTLLDTFGTTSLTAYDNLEVVAPAESAYAIVNTNNVSDYPPMLRYAVTAEEKVKELDKRTLYNQDRVFHPFYPVQMESIMRERDKNPFVFAEFDKGYVSFVFDDLRRQQDSVASIFEEYGYPLCLAAIPSQMTVTANGLSASRGNFAPGMTMKEVCDQVVANGGEIMSHNAPVVTATNQYDYDFMYDYFVGTKSKLQDLGYTVRGLIRAGGSGYIRNSEETAKWSEAFYEYSDFGYSVNHSLQRIDLNQDVENIKAAIDTAVSDRQWIQFYGHDYDYGGGTTLTGEADLREILDYVESSGITVVTYGYIFDHFSSSQIAENSGRDLTWIEAIPTEHVAGSVWDCKKNEAYGNSEPNYEYSAYTVKGGEKYKVTGGSAYISDSFPLVAFFKPGKNYRLSAYGTDRSTKYEDYQVVVPTGATKMVVNCYDNKGNPSTSAMKETQLDMAAVQEQVDSIKTRLTTAEGVLSDHADDIEDLADRVLDLATASSTTHVEVTPTSLTSEAIIAANNKTVTQRPGESKFEYASYPVQPGEIYLVTGSSGAYPTAYPCAMCFSPTSNYRLAMFGTDENTRYEDLKVTIPNSATELIVQNASTTSGKKPVSAKKRVPFDINALQTIVADLQERVTALEGGS